VLQSIPNLNLTVLCLWIADRHRHALEVHRERHPDHSVWRTHVYEIDAERRRLSDATWMSFDAGTFLHRAYFASALERHAGILKALDALLRYAFAAARPVEHVGFLVWPGGTLAGLRARSAAGTVELRVDRLGHGQPVVQSGDPRRWFAAAEWLDEVRSIDERSSNRLAMRFAESHRAALLDLGAAEVTPSLWVPGPGTCRTDLASVVWDRSRRSRPACRGPS
jgi:hypothetical protein